MSGAKQIQKSAQALEITAALTGRRFGLCGYDSGERERFSRLLSKTGSLVVPFDERMIGDSAQFCDAVLYKLAGASPAGLRVAATAPTAPILVTGSSQAILEGAGAAYLWPHDFMGEPWTESELLVRIFRLLARNGGCPVVGAAQPRTAPLVLLADDDPELVALVEIILRNDAIACTTAADGLRALRLARELRPDLIILDVTMPEMDGFAVLETIRRDPSLQTLPVIFLTACDEPVDIMRGAELEADEYLSKPVSPIRLLSRVKRLLSGHVRGTSRWARYSPNTAGTGETAGRPWMFSKGSRPAVEEQR